MSSEIRFQTRRFTGIVRTTFAALALFAVGGSGTCVIAQEQPAASDMPVIAPATETPITPVAATPEVIEPAKEPAAETQPAAKPSAAAEPTTWQIAIIPATGHDRGIRQVREGVALPTYREAYNSVPFNRAEYEANPGYRHDAAMEIMFGQMRPTTIVRHYSPQAFRYPRPSVRYYTPGLSPYYNLGGFGYRPGYNPILTD